MGQRTSSKCSGQLSSHIKLVKYEAGCQRKNYEPGKLSMNSRYNLFIPKSRAHSRIAILCCLDEESPLWEISARDLTSKMQFEVVLTMEGITPETGNTIQVNCKYAAKQFEAKFEHFV